ncbi:MAG: hypothetical protein JWQ63_1066 [Mucilaginibacter sp.]|nr:hypothetical protein [Mucilaginibacter sp.]
MGKPFNKELDNVHNTLEWGLNQVVKDLKNEILHYKKPLLVVGSGGSLSACHYAVSLYQQHGIIAKAITPLELFYSKSILRESNVLFISASGKNTDILFAYKTAISCEPTRIYSICMQLNSPLAKLAENVSISKHFEFSLPSGKDGFLATNSLIAFFSVLYQALSINKLPAIIVENNYTSFHSDLKKFIEKVTPDFTLTVLHAGWGQPVAIDLESKLAEAALSDVLISDYRNFGHGRHHWFDKRKNNSAIIALVTKEEEKLAEKTLAILPHDIPVLRITSEISGAMASIDLLIKSFFLINELGKIQGIDPGRPGVPDFGSNLYHLKYQQLFTKRGIKPSLNEQMAIIRKSGITVYEQLNSDEKKYWSVAYHSYMDHLQQTAFGSIIFDYDGTICSSKNRFEGVDNEIKDYLLKILSQGFIVGIATGRGKSVRTDLQKIIPVEFRNRVIIGYYNCSEMGTLDNDAIPDKQKSNNESLIKVYDILKSYHFPVEVTVEMKPHQLTIVIENKDEWEKIRNSIIQLIMIQNIPNIQILESSHSMDIIDQSCTSKLNIMEQCQQMANLLNIPSESLFIGDKGQWPGNDFQLLSNSCSLSVDEVSSLYNSCWNLASPGIKNIKATEYYLSCLNFQPKAMFIHFK